MALAVVPTTTVALKHPKDTPYQLDPDQVSIVPQSVASFADVGRLSKPLEPFSNMYRPRQNDYGKPPRSEVC